MDINKCKFEITNIKYLGFIIKTEKDIYMDPDKIKVIKKWKILTTVKKVRNFFDFANFYQQFI